MFSYLQATSVPWYSTDSLELKGAELPLYKVAVQHLLTPRRRDYQGSSDREPRTHDFESLCQLSLVFIADHLEEIQMPAGGKKEYIV